ncbi:hypothetical protein BGZ83_002609 [Gryganskiella cystojenkinii]|nr:hypothetical protein BGZ83_002609 [Gryganskiella cystojenkinii]
MTANSATTEDSDVSEQGGSNDVTQSGKSMSKTKHLESIETSEQDMTSSLQKQLQHARETTASLNEATTEGAESKNRSPEELKQALVDALEKQKQQDAIIKKLRHEVDVERGHATILRHDNQVLRQKQANMHAVAEQEEENISNRLLKRISGLKKEKGELMLQVEQEEEYLTKTLQKKLTQLQKEKVDMENALEQEQEYIVNRLQKQLDAMRMEQQSAGTSTASSSWQDRDHHMGSTMGSLSVASSLPIGSSPINIAGGGGHGRHSGSSSSGRMNNPVPSPTPSPTHKKWIPSHSPSSSDIGIGPPSHPIVDMLKAELTAAKATLNELEREYMIKFKLCNRYRSELVTLRQEYGLPVASDLLVEDHLPNVLSSTHRTGGTPSRRNSSTSTSSRVTYGVPATPTNTPANPAPINNHHFSTQRATLSPNVPLNNPFVPGNASVSSSSSVAGAFSSSPTLAAFPTGFPGSQHQHQHQIQQHPHQHQLQHGTGGGTGGAGFSSSAAAAAIAAAASSGSAHHHGNQPYASSGANSGGTNSFSSSVGSLGSTSPMMSMASSLSSTSGGGGFSSSFSGNNSGTLGSGNTSGGGYAGFGGSNNTTGILGGGGPALPAIVPERQSLYRSKSSSRQHNQYLQQPPTGPQYHQIHQQQHQLAQEKGQQHSTTAAIPSSSSGQTPSS